MYTWLTLNLKRGLKNSNHMTQVSLNSLMMCLTCSVYSLMAQLSLLLMAKSSFTTVTGQHRQSKGVQVWTKVPPGKTRKTKTLPASPISRSVHVVLYFERTLILNLNYEENPLNSAAVSDSQVRLPQPHHPSSTLETAVANLQIRTTPRHANQLQATHANRNSPNRRERGALRPLRRACPSFPPRRPRRLATETKSERILQT